MRRRDSTRTCRVHLDAEFDEYDLVAEIDGQQHMDALAWWEDMARNNEVVAETASGCCGSQDSLFVRAIGWQTFCDGSSSVTSAPVPASPKLHDGCI